ncbi:VWA domain-containing protein [Terriglobus albidus]|uniref:VWA domain-containing protein n=1 Tax=Terriglobus albidus TaxID=1592106 RepID=UPI0021E07F4C|nr:VWA domain-containing protein [Terriglobus albidus]
MTRRLLLSLVLSSSCVWCAQVLIAQDSPKPIQGVGAKLVHVPTVVHDKKGALILTLKKEDFILKVDGKPQEIRYFSNDANLPLTLGLLVDVSGSVASRLDDERRASSAFLDDMLTSNDDRAFVIQFGHKADLLADLTHERGKLQEGLKQLEGDRPGSGSGPGDRGPGDRGPGDRNGGPPPDDDRQGSRSFFQFPGDGGGRSGRRGGQGGSQGGRGGFGGGGTVLYDAVFLGSDELMKKQTGRKALILLTDGEDRGSKVTLARSLEAAQRSDTIIYAIYYKGDESRGQRGFGGGPRGSWPGPGGGAGNRNGDGKKVLERMTQETGGQVFEVSKKHPVDEIYKEIARELRSQYRIEFTPDQATGSDGYHQIDLTTKDNKLFVQTRDGYYVGEPSR